MAIHINLLAEAIEAEEIRRKDPAKRAIWAGALLVVLMLLWATLLMGKILSEKQALRRQEGTRTSQEKQTTAVTDNEKKLAEINRNLDALNRLATNRFLWGSVLDAIQRSTVDQIQVIRIRTEQSYLPFDGVRAETVDGKFRPGKPASSTEHKTLTIDARDYGKVEEQHYHQFEQKIGENPFFQTYFKAQESISLKSRSASRPDPANPDRSFVSFVLECKFPDVARNE